MATLKIYNDIQTSDEQSFMRLMGAAEGVTFRDINEFVGGIAEDDNAIDLRLHCDGGSVTEGWAMYDCLRMSGKEITATVEGTCASMATVVLMAAPKERRQAYANAHILLHNPFIMTGALGDMATADELMDAGSNLRAEQERMVDLYVERCGCDREELVALMREDRFINADEALRLGVIGKILPPVSAKKRNMMEVKASLIDRMLAKLGMKTLDEVEAMESPEAMKAMELNTEDGNTINVEREEGTPQVGDVASPDGEWHMSDGSIIVVEDGYITEIRREDATAAVVTEDEQKGETAAEEVEGSDDELQHLRDRVAELEHENEELRRQVEELGGKAKTEEEARLLGLLALAGGEKALARISSEYTPEPRQPKGAKASAVVSASDILDKYERVYGKR